MTSSEAHDSPVIVRYEPRRWRFLARAILASGVWVFAGLLITWGYERPYTWRVAMFPLGFFLWLNLGDLVWRWPGFVIILSPSDVTGFSFLPQRTRCAIPLHDLDKLASARRGVFWKLLGVQCLRSVSGSKIYFRRWAFARDDVRKLLSSLGLDGAAIQ